MSRHIETETWDPLSLLVPLRAAFPRAYPVETSNAEAHV